MNKRRAVRISIGIGAFLVLLLFVAVTALWWRGGFVRSANDDQEQSYVQVCMVTRALLRGEVIGEQDVQMVTWLADLTPAEACSSPEQVVGQCATHAMPARSLVTTYDLAGHDHQLDIPQGYDAVSVEASQIKAVAGAITPGSVVDMYCHRDGQTYLLLEQIKVLDIASDASWITVALQPDRVQEVIAASAAKALYFSKPSITTQENSAPHLSHEDENR